MPNSTIKSNTTLSPKEAMAYEIGYRRGYRDATNNLMAHLGREMAVSRYQYLHNEIDDIIKEFNLKTLNKEKTHAP